MSGFVWRRVCSANLKENLAAMGRAELAKRDASIRPLLLLPATFSQPSYTPKSPVFMHLVRNVLYHLGRLSRKKNVSVLPLHCLLSSLPPTHQASLSFSMSNLYQEGSQHQRDFSKFTTPFYKQYLTPQAIEATGRSGQPGGRALDGGRSPLPSSLPPSSPILSPRT